MSFYIITILIVSITSQQKKMKLLAEKIKALVKALQATKKTKRRIKRKKKVRDRK